MCRPQVQLQTYSGESLTLVGETDMKVRYGQQVASLPLIIVKGKSPNLFGRNWMQTLKLKWEEIFYLHSTGRTSHEEGGIQHKELITKYQEVFKEEMGLLEGATASIAMRSDTAPWFFKPRPVPYAYKELVEQELRRLERDEIIEAVRFSDWAASVVPVLKKDGSNRICGDFRLTINQAAPCEKYPLPKINGIFASLAGGQLFTKLDLSHAYQQVALDEMSRKYVVINTHLGLFKYKRLPFGVSSGPAIFQRVMDTLLQDIPMTVVYLDDILVTGRCLEEHLQNLEMVLQRLANSGLRLKPAKCAFLQKEISYLGHTINSQGLAPDKKKVMAIQAAPEPENVTELRSFLGMINYYGRFLPKLASRLAPLYQLLRQNVR